MKPPDGSASTPNAKKKSSAKAQSMNHTALCKQQVQIPGCVPTSLSQDHKTLPLFLLLDDLSSCFNSPIHVFSLTL